ncbi:SUMF1/EgtB/PvdO family nonheme iron enzyme [Flavobacteriaceae bacterium S356]|uniref:SUMF1/EgtB/PvdO family nonheme iron enzyme n=1 Tax=Asprobacillus argus TaxID=3076534 RepID=A0ABU3LEZ2_9FLAO|nr:SUMF1/EgtB/PvdO family nonheme iron enzyme [Flavobacteriaceae bacterium S356]
MNLLKKMLVVIILVTPSLNFANDIEVKNISFNQKTKKVSFNLSWKNSWKNQKNFDAAWVFVKFIDSKGDYIHGKLATKKHRLKGAQKGVFELPSDRVGVFVHLADAYRGDVAWNVDLKIDDATSKRLSNNYKIHVFALEMVYIPKGDFYVGATEPEAVNYASFYESDVTGEPVKPFLISSEDQVINVSPTEGNLYYKIGRSPYRGDSKGSIPATFPKGHDAFYMMKYETTQGFYSDFLNALSPALASTLSPHTVNNYYKEKGGIRFANNRYKADTYNRPANFITWDDGATLADWAGLRPMTEFEFTKAARGAGKPMVHEFPWGTASTKDLKRKVELNDELILTDGVVEKDLNENNRHLYGASYYWVMDLAGSLWEKCVTIGHPIGRNYTGTHGDGLISKEGTATNIDWPKGIREEGGYGYRGGGYYSHGKKATDYNPHSPTAYRPYGSWAGGKRSIAYSQRYVRTAGK